MITYRCIITKNCSLEFYCDVYCLKIVWYLIPETDGSYEELSIGCLTSVAYFIYPVSAIGSTEYQLLIKILRFAFVIPGQNSVISYRIFLYHIHIDLCYCTLCLAFFFSMELQPKNISGSYSNVVITQLLAEISLIQRGVKDCVSQRLCSIEYTLPHLALVWSEQFKVLLKIIPRFWTFS